jgi:hypothetical protein
VVKSAANADGGILLTAVLARRKNGELVLLLNDPDMPGGIREEPLDENSDHALDLYARLKKSKGEGGKYTAATLFLRSSTHRRLQFT